jgi:hypothetical protein
MKTRSQTINCSIPFVPEWNKFQVPKRTSSKKIRENTLVPGYNGLEVKPIYEVNIDFDEASTAWRANKRKLDNCCYEYICGFILKNNKRCQKKTCNLHKTQ